MSIKGKMYSCLTWPSPRIWLTSSCPPLLFEPVVRIMLLISRYQRFRLFCTVSDLHRCCMDFTFIKKITWIAVFGWGKEIKGQVRKCISYFERFCEKRFCVKEFIKKWPFWEVNLFPLEIDHIGRQKTSILSRFQKCQRALVMKRLKHRFYWQKILMFFRTIVLHIFE